MMKFMKHLLNKQKVSSTSEEIIDNKGIETEDSPQNMASVGANQERTNLENKRFHPSDHTFILQAKLICIVLLSA